MSACSNYGRGCMIESADGGWAAVWDVSDGNDGAG